MGKGTSCPDILASNSNTAAADNKTTAETASFAPRCLPPESSLLPTIIVFDLDDCLWTPEMHELSGLPSIAVEGPLDPNDAESTLGTVGMKVPSRRSRSTRRGGGGFDWGSQDGEEIVELYPGARHVLRQLVINPIYKNVQIAVASTSLAPSYSMACINGLEIVEDVSLRSILSYIQVGRDGKLSTRKTSHFQLLHEESGGVPYSEMLFFDDCNWADHVGDLDRELGVVGVRTPHGLTMEAFHLGLEKFRLANSSVDAENNSNG